MDMPIEAANQITTIFRAIGRSVSYGMAADDTEALRTFGAIVRGALLAQQVGVINKGGREAKGFSCASLINAEAFAEEAQMQGLLPVDMGDHVRLYRVPTDPTPRA